MKVVTLSPGVGNSPHYIFHSALHEIRRLESSINHTDVSESALNAIAQNVVFLWRGDNSDYEAGRYLMDIESSIYEELTDGGKFNLELADVPDLGMWLKQSLKEYKDGNENEFVIARFESMVENYQRTRRSTPRSTI